ncbi:histidyl-tRNA synthetase [Metamycoplasma cloacale]|uniref:Histidine--tRNA ligase n=1 Tax=Metamycoplasma cloacale TaxID=92401 RepID=A0A2Z4LM23_9BACT|nr:histidine--tRNA ligase [Metamycoplasma cloacale]AWX42822.1 histidine--tRNA ligase [Metamycoplasma cloacale]VEU79359.1 histidyl-tRNA synthetase [Metamycoplasma cloacale]
MFNRLKGTRDIFGYDSKILDYIRNTFFDIAKKYNYSYIETPIIEEAELFIRSSGETSDIVSKEMYLFKDKGDRNLALRPEGTASIIRAFVENKIDNLQQSKLFYFGPMFRYERPQKGRYRQFLQGGVELIAPKNELNNFEIIKLAYDFLKKLKIENLVLEINNLGSIQTRNEYIKKLKSYFEPYKKDFDELTLSRLEKNVLRILDDKNLAELDFVKNAPKLLDYLTVDEKEQFNSLLNLLKAFNIDYVINPNLVRGLDYYNDIVFEFVSSSEALGTKSTVLAGGRYDGMISEFNGPNLDSIGFAFGVDRIMEIIKNDCQNIEELTDQIDILIGYTSDFDKDEIVKIAYDLRKNFTVHLINQPTTIKNLFKQKFNLNPKLLIFKELNSKPMEIKIKNQELDETIIYSDSSDISKILK